MIVEYYLTAYPAVYGQFPQAIPQPIAAIPTGQREGKINNKSLKNESQMKKLKCLTFKIK